MRSWIVETIAVYGGEEQRSRANRGRMLVPLGSTTWGWEMDYKGPVNPSLGDGCSRPANPAIDLSKYAIRPWDGSAMNGSLRSLLVA